MSVLGIPIPPLELRRMVGPTDEEDFDNSSGEPIYREYGLPVELYDSVFDFGCGCGRVARQLLLQTPRPRRYVGIDPHQGLIDWSKKNLSAVDAAFRFSHHDVYSPSYAPKNSLRLSEPFPVGDGEFSLFIAYSTFTHLCREQTEYYLGELTRILRPDGVAFTTWFFFDRDSFPFLIEGPFCLYTSAECFSEAVIYDRRWFIDTVRRLGLRVRTTTPPILCGHQWMVLLEKCTPGAADQFPLEQDEAEWLCGATLKPRPATTPSSTVMHKVSHPSRIDDRQKGTISVPRTAERPKPPELFGTLAELEKMRRSWTWKTGRAVTAPARALKRFLNS